MQILRRSFLFVVLLMLSQFVFSAEGVNVVYPKWFKNSLYDLPGDLQDAADAGKSGIMVFFSTKTCSYCKAILEKALQQKEIVSRLRKNYDVIGLEVISDTEVVDTRGKTSYAKNFAVSQKAMFTPTMIFYGLDGNIQLRLIGYQSPEKVSRALDYLEGQHYKKINFASYLRQGVAGKQAKVLKSNQLDLTPAKSGDKLTIVIFESASCEKCNQLKEMLKASVIKPYLKYYRVESVSSDDNQQNIITPGGKKLSGKDWMAELGLIHQPAMLFFNEKGLEVLRVDTDILVDPYGNPVPVNDPQILDNIRARLQFVHDKAYITIPQYQRWRASEARKKRAGN